MTCKMEQAHHKLVFDNQKCFYCGETKREMQLQKRIAELEAAIKQIEDITLWAHDFRKSGELLLKIRAVCYGITQKTKTDTAAGG